ncbi:MAG: WecB/TagA/CpsF family glycosyltransferase [Actinomycetia bacterium]|nr:WecB/TagA/CpsF family glycosyltransferase [Actinomycetes bacterium]
MPNHFADHEDRTLPPKRPVLGVNVSQTNYDEVVDLVLAAAQSHQSMVVSLFAAHAVVTSSRDPELLAKVNNFEIVAPDGQPVRWALNQLHGSALEDRVYGPELMLRSCAAAAQLGVGIYLYGGSPQVATDLPVKLQELFPGLEVVGSESPPYRALTAQEHADFDTRVRESGAAIVFIGLGCPKQDEFAHTHRDRIPAVQVCVGAAFDFHAGTKEMAPSWMQDRGLEWAFRLGKEPKRLWRRYLVTNTQFAVGVARQRLTQRSAPDRFIAR